jgi:hypothetical protein
MGKGRREGILLTKISKNCCYWNKFCCLWFICMCNKSVMSADPSIFFEKECTWLDFNKTSYKYSYCTCYRLDIGFGLVIAFTEILQLVTTSNYKGIVKRLFFFFFLNTRTFCSFGGKLDPSLNYITTDVRSVMSPPAHTDCLFLMNYNAPFQVYVGKIFSTLHIVVFVITTARGAGSMPNIDKCLRSL